MHAACRKLDDIPSDQFIELAGPADQSESIAHFLVRDGHGLDCFRPKSLTTREWTGVQKWSCRHAAVPPRLVPSSNNRTKRLGIFWEILGFYCEEEENKISGTVFTGAARLPNCK
jgi:hypothetical protein